MSDAIQNLLGRLGVTLDGNGNLTTTGNVTAKGALAVTGNATVSGNQTVTGNLTVTGTIVGAGQATLTGAPVAVNTVGAATLTAAQLAAKNITRGGTQTANWTDTTDTAVAIFAQFPNATLGQIFSLEYINNSSFGVTIAGGVGVTGASVFVPSLTSVDIYFTITSSTAVAMATRSTGDVSNLPDYIYQTTAATSGVITAGLLTGGTTSVLSSSGATALTTPTAAALLAATPNGGLGTSWLIRLINTNAGTLTITADATVTVTGTKTLATNTWREFICTILTATTASWQQIGTGTTS